VLLGVPSIASAQSSDPLPGCQVKELKNLGPQLYDTATKTWSVAVEVHLICDGIELFADMLTWNDKTVTASGNLLVTQEETLPTGERVSVLRLNADRMEMDRETRLATFYHAYGTARITNEPGEKTMFGRQEPDILFQAEKIERLGPKKYRLTNGAFTTCLQPNPRWRMIGGSGMVELGDHATMTNVRFMVKSIPVLYVPYLYYPLTKDDRSTGLLIPSYSSSAINGNGLSNGYFIVLGKSHDATLFHDYYTKAGQGAAVEYRFASAPGAGGQAKFHAFYEKEQLREDGTVERFAHTSYTFDGATTQSLGHGFTLVGNSTYFTDITAQQRYQQNVYAASNQRRNIVVEVSGPVKLGRAASKAPTMRLRGLYRRDEIFSGTQSSLQGSAPKVTVQLYDNVLKSDAACRGERQNFLCRATYNITGETAYLQSRPFGPTDLPALETTVRRFDALSQLRAPLSSLPYLSVSTIASWRLTEYLDSRDPLTGVVGSVPLTRNVFGIGASVIGPTLERVFRTPGGRLGEGFLHTIQPRVQVDWLSTFDRADRIFVIDQVDQVPVGTTSVSYSLTNSVRLKPRGADGATQNRDFLSVAIAQKYYSNAQAAIVDPANPIAGAGTLSPVQIAIVVSPSDRVRGQLSVFKNTLAWPKPGLPQPSTQYNGQAWVNLSERLVLSGGWSKTNYYTASQGFVDIAPVHALNAVTTVNAKDKRMGATYGFNFDVINQKFLQQRIQVYYHAQCCGFALDYQAYSTLSSTVPIDHRVAVTFTLAGIGSFSPPLGAFGR
jgi:hypothetical protein